MNKTNHEGNTNANKKWLCHLLNAKLLLLETITFYDFDSPYEYLENCYWEKTDQTIRLVHQDNQTVNN